MDKMVDCRLIAIDRSFSLCTFGTCMIPCRMESADSREVEQRRQRLNMTAEKRPPPSRGGRHTEVLAEPFAGVDGPTEL